MEAAIRQHRQCAMNCLSMLPLGMPVARPYRTVTVY
jgi:hypothetical protein